MVCAGQPHRHVGDFDDRPAVGVHEGIDDGVGLRTVAEFADRHLVGDYLGRLKYLPATAELACHAGDRLPDGLVGLGDPAHAQQ